MATLFTLLPLEIQRLLPCTKTCSKFQNIRNERSQNENQKVLELRRYGAVSFGRDAPRTSAIISDTAICSSSNGFYPLTIVAKQSIFYICVRSGYASNQVKLLFNLFFNCRFAKNVSSFWCGRDFNKKMPNHLIRICRQSKLDQKGAENVILQLHILSDTHFA